MATNSQYLKQFHEIERELWILFALFGDLCGRCARRTLRESAQGQRKHRDQWCCCMIDNQVHDNWETLNAVQSRRNRGWYAALEPLEMGRMPGNGPCPALGPAGCRLPKHRPITCTTQLCTKMLRVLQKLGLHDGPVAYALQIEDLLPLPEILPALYGSARTGQPAVATPEAVAQYRLRICDFRRRMESVSPAKRQAVLDTVLPGD